MGRRLARRPCRGYLPAMALRSSTLAVFSVGVALLAGCQQSTVQAPREQGACWHFITQDDGTTKFNRVGASQPNLEFCAARLERLRMSYMSLGGDRTEWIGAYQGRFIFLEPSGIKTAKSLNGNRYMALVRTGDGRLVVPGAMRRVSE
jgi:hypothetical protein